MGKTIENRKSIMKSADVVVHLSKDLNVSKRGVTPIEALLLTAEHHKNVGGDVIDGAAADKVAKEVADPVFDEEGKPAMKDGKPVTKTRTDDDEIDRLRVKYGPAKVKALTSEVRTFPADFVTACKKGVQVVLPSSPLSQTKLL
jgi:hypothetical protein